MSQQTALKCHLFTGSLLGWVQKIILWLAIKHISDRASGDSIYAVTGNLQFTCGVDELGRGTCELQMGKLLLVVALKSLKDVWDNTPPNWIGSDPCGSGWEGVRCTNDQFLRHSYVYARCHKVPQVPPQLATPPQPIAPSSPSLQDPVTSLDNLPIAFRKGGALCV